MKRQYLFHSLRVPIKPYQNKPKKTFFLEKAWANEKNCLTLRQNYMKDYKGERT